MLLLSDEKYDITLVTNPVTSHNLTIMTSEAEKLSSHLALLRAEYVKLQQKCTRLERDLAVVSAQVGNVTLSVMRCIYCVTGG